MSSLEYKIVTPDAQAIVVTCPALEEYKGAAERWKGKAAVIIGDSEALMRDVVRDILANPQIRALVFDGEVHARQAYADFWAGAAKPEWKIDEEHLKLVRQFVDLYDGEFAFKGHRHPFHPSRIRYL